MSHIGSVLDDDCVIFDSSSGKCYNTLFDLEQAFWDAKIYQSGDLPDPPDEIKSVMFKSTPIAFKTSEMDIDSLMEDVTPTWTQRLDGVFITGFNTMPNNVNIYAIMADDIF